MNAFVKYCVLLLVAVIYLGQGIDSTRYLTKATEQERLISHEKDNFERLAMLIAMNGNALPVNTIQDVSSVQPTFPLFAKESCIRAFRRIQENFYSLFQVY